jgi:hypothetical protein
VYGVSEIVAIAVEVPIHLTSGRHQIQAWWNLSWVDAMNYTMARCSHSVSVGWYCEQESLFLMRVEAQLVDSSNGSVQWSTAYLDLADSAGWQQFCEPQCFSYTLGSNHSSTGSAGIDFGWNYSARVTWHHYFLSFFFEMALGTIVSGYKATYAGGAGTARLDFGTGSNGGRLTSIAIS